MQTRLHQFAIIIFGIVLNFSVSAQDNSLQCSELFVNSNVNFGASNARPIPDSIQQRSMVGRLRAAHELRAQLREKMSADHVPLNYKTARDFVVTFVDSVHRGRRIWNLDVYCRQWFQVTGTKFSGLLGVNVEHMWPRSRFGAGETRAMKSDMHHLYPVDAWVNSARKSLMFGEVEQENKKMVCTEAKLGLNSNGDMRFEPPDEHKGNVARAMFYFSVRYGVPLSAEEAATFRRWNKMDPVSSMERERNNRIQALQGNRNVFIDNSNLMDAVSDY